MNAPNEPSPVNAPPVIKPTSPLTSSATLKPTEAKSDFPDILLVLLCIATVVILLLAFFGHHHFKHHPRLPEPRVRNGYVTKREFGALDESVVFLPAKEEHRDHTST